MDTIKRIFRSPPKLFALLVCLLLLSGCKLKTKQELYMERGLDILDNVVSLDDWELGPFTLRKLGVIKHTKAKKYTLVIEVEEPESRADDQIIRLVLSGNGIQNQERIEIEPNIVRVGGYHYIQHTFESGFENKINTVDLFLIWQETKLPASDTLKLQNVYIDNE